MIRFLPDLPANEERRVPLPERDGLSASVHMLDRRSVLAVNAALAAGRPLLVRGKPGTGKSQLARAAAEELGRHFVSMTLDLRTEIEELFYSVDNVRRLAEAQVVGAAAGHATTDEERKRRKEEIEEKLDILQFVEPGPLWKAFDRAGARELVHNALGQRTPPAKDEREGAVLLLDEIDKADSSVPNALLEALGNRRFRRPRRGRPAPGNDDEQNEFVSVTGLDPLVIITTNEERAVPDAFLRRCLVLHLKLPDGKELVDFLVRRGEAHFCESDEESAEEALPDDDATPVVPPSNKLLTNAAVLLSDDRKFWHDSGQSEPGLAEYLDLVRALCEQIRHGPDLNPQNPPSDDDVNQARWNLLQEIREFGFQKHEPRKAVGSNDAGETAEG